MQASHLVRTALAILLVSGLLSGSLLSQEQPTMSLAQRLKSVTHVGLRHNQQLGGYTVKVYSKEHATKTAEDRERARKDAKAINERIDSLQLRIQESKAKAKSQEEINALFNELTSAQASLRDSAVPESLYKVVAVGRDYIELESLSDADVERIVPFHSISTIQLEKASKNTAENSAKRD